MRPSPHHRFSVWTIWIPVVLVLLAVPAARGQAQPDEAPLESRVVRPTPAEPNEVLYPPDAEGENVVVLHLVVETDGSISEAVAVEGDEPFATVARRAALTWKFHPARRDGKPIPAKIRFEVRFVPPPEPPPEPPSEPAPSPSTEPPELAPSAESPPAGTPAAPSAIPRRTPVTVFVHGERKPPSARSFTRAEVRQLPGAFGDPFRAIEALPGVTPMVTGIPYFFVRGAPPGNVGYYLDGIRVPLLYHVALGPSVIHPGIVSHVDLHAGGYPARFGRFTGGIVSAETTPPAASFRGEGNIRLVDAGILLEDAWSHGDTTATVGGRYSYTAAALSLLSPEVVLQYWDYQFRAARRLDDTDTIGVFGFGAYDYLGEKQEDSTETIFSTQFHRVDVRYDHERTDDERLRFAVTAGLDRTDSPDDDGPFLRDRMAAARLEWKQRTRENLWLRAGADVVLDFYDIVPPEDDDWDDPEEDDDRDQFARLFPSRTDVTTGAYLSASLRVAPRVVFTPGIRTDLHHSDGATAVGVDPRLSAEYEVSETVRLEHTLGLVHQPPAFAIPVPGFQIGGLSGGLQRALQSSAGVHLTLPSDVKLSATAFQNVFFDMTDALGVARADAGDFGDNLELRSLGRSVGLEIYLRRRLSRRLGGFLSYTLSRSTRSFGRSRVLSSFDRTHVLHAALAYNLGRRWRAGTRVTYYSGFPGELTEEAWLARLTPQRSPGFFRGDIRLEKRWRINEAGAWLALVFEVVNATLSKEVVDYECGLDGCTSEDIGPVTIPSVGIEAAF